MTSTEHVDAQRVWVAPGVARCPTCRAAVTVGTDAALPIHPRWADGSGPDGGQPHDLWTCEGEQPWDGGTMPVVISDEATLVAVRAVSGEPELGFPAVLAAAAPHLIRDWVIAVLDQHPHITPRQLRKTAAGLLPGEQQ